MTYQRMPKVKAQAERDLRIARLVKRELVRLGYVATLHDIRDVHGARLDYVNLHVGNLSVACRAASDKPTEAELAALQSAGAYIQYGSQDITELVTWIKARTMPHWNA